MDFSLVDLWFDPKNKLVKRFLEWMYSPSWDIRINYKWLNNRNILFELENRYKDRWWNYYKNCSAKLEIGVINDKVNIQDFENWLREEIQNLINILYVYDKAIEYVIDKSSTVEYYFDERDFFVNKTEKEVYIIAKIQNKEVKMPISEILKLKNLDQQDLTPYFEKYF